MKSTTITLRAADTTMKLLAVRRANDTAVTFVTTSGPDKKAVRGMTEEHTSMDVATAHICTLATKAEKLGWKRSTRSIFRAKPDTFSTLPAAPKATTNKK